MSIRRLPLVLALFVCAACTDSENLSGKSWAPDGACKFVGNRADKHYCATTAIQILANPEVYDGRLVVISGWVAVGPVEEGTAFLYLTREALDGADRQGALQLLSGPKFDRLFTRSSPHSDPIVWDVAGRFHLNRGKPGEEASIDGIVWNSFGSMDEIDDI